MSIHDNEIMEKLRTALRSEIAKHNLSGRKIKIRCKALSAEEAIGTPEDLDYPIIKGREKIVEADFEGSKGQAFSDDFENRNYSINEIADLKLDSNRNRADFISSLNAVYRHMGLCTKTVHCRDYEPRECAEKSLTLLGLNAGAKILLVGLQPRFLEFLSRKYPVRVLDMDRDNIGTERFGIEVESPEKTEGGIQWCDTIFSTGSTIVNGTISTFLDRDKPVIFFGVTISAAARILGLKTYCECGR